MRRPKLVGATMAVKDLAPTARFLVDSREDLLRILQNQLGAFADKPRPTNFCINVQFLHCVSEEALLATADTEVRIQRAIVEVAGLTLKSFAYAEFQEPGDVKSWSCAGVLAESHFGMSCWLPQRALHSDLTICNYESDNGPKILDHFGIWWDLCQPGVAVVQVQFAPLSTSDLE